MYRTHLIKRIVNQPKNILKYSTHLENKSDFEQKNESCMCGAREKMIKEINQLKKENSELNFMINELHEQKLKKEKKEISELWGQTFAFAVVTTIIYFYGIPKLI